MADTISDADTPATIRVQVCYATPQRQLLRDLIVAQGCTLQQAIEHSGVLLDAPEIDLSNCRVGIYNKLKTLDTVLREHDRVEIYRPLIVDPKQSRRKRAEKKSGSKSG
jgi:putative ubiquitin-RnfH superfamily antitoxin RatB of RatAB toxin-antitoxin module